ncbi:MAG: peptidyl-alpha-hydroxyglycine alpha-amidating lyase family protein [Pseudomonadales bacterium]|jgi:DNA-binding beta-propeller fold protein YncE
MTRNINRILRGIPGLAILVAAAALTGAPARAENYAPNPYRTIEGWGKLPDGREWGSTSAIYPTSDGKHIWVAERCGANLCVGSDVDPVLLFDLDGNLIRSFGAGLIAWPHGIYVDAEDNVWIADANGYAPIPEGWGHVVYKFSPEGELLMTLGEKGVAGDGRTTLRKPCDVLVAPDGSIFVADGHASGPDQPANNRIVKFDADGNYLLEFGGPGTADGELNEPHGLAMDSQGRLFVADRGNSRVQIFDQEGNHLDTWYQFGRPSGVFIDSDDRLYVADSESNSHRNAGYKRGIRIGSARDGFVTAFIPDPEPDQDNSGTSGAEGVAVDALGDVYGAEVGPKGVKKYVPK